MNASSMVYEITCGEISIEISGVPGYEKIIVEDISGQYWHFKHYRLMWYRTDEDMLYVNQNREDIQEYIDILFQDCEEWPEWLWDFRAALIRDFL